MIQYENPLACETHASVKRIKRNKPSNFSFEKINLKKETNSKLKDQVFALRRTNMKRRQLI